MNAMAEQNILFRSQRVPGYFLRFAEEQDDAQLLALITESMPSNGMVLSFERQPSYFQATRAQYNTPEIIVVLHEDDPSQIIGMMNLGWKDYWINGEQSKIRYVSDLRIKRTSRGKKTIEVFMEFIYQHYGEDMIFHSVILEDNHVARTVMQQEQKGFPTPCFFDSITTYTVSKVPKVSQVQYRLEQLNQSNLDVANAFVVKMGQRYNYLPTYDFRQLAEAMHPFWHAMRLEDFYLVRDRDNQIAGLFGLWNQKSFKQTKVASYSRLLKLAKPFYNAYAVLTHELKLPKEGEAFDYMMAHSMICHPEAIEVMHYMLAQALQKVQDLGKTSFCVTVAENDPRKQILDRCRAHKMKAVHTMHSYQPKHFGTVDRSKISYFEVGRI